MIALWKGIVEKIHFGGSIINSSFIYKLHPEKPSFRPSKWPRMLKLLKLVNCQNFQNTVLSELEKVGVGILPSSGTLTLREHSPFKHSNISEWLQIELGHKVTLKGGCMYSPYPSSLQSLRVRSDGWREFSSILHDLWWTFTSGLRDLGFSTTPTCKTPRMSNIKLKSMAHTPPISNEIY
jgi:hypothetical protein